MNSKVFLTISELQLVFVGMALYEILLESNVMMATMSILMRVLLYVNFQYVAMVLYETLLESNVMMATMSILMHVLHRVNCQYVAMV